MSRAGLRVPFDVAVDIAQHAAEAISARFRTINVCGSIRRMSPTVGDVDFVVVGKFDDEAIRTCLLTVFDEAVPDVENRPDRPRICHTVKSHDVDIGIDVWMVPRRFRGSAVMHATGSGLFNAILRRWARSRGLMMDVWGIHRDDRVVASETEHDCFDALGLPFIRPQDRHEGSLGYVLDVLNR